MFILVRRIVVAATENVAVGGSRGLSWSLLASERMCGWSLMMRLGERRAGRRAQCRETRRVSPCIVDKGEEFAGRLSSDSTIKVRSCGPRVIFIQISSISPKSHGQHGYEHSPPANFRRINSLLSHGADRRRNVYRRGRPRKPYHPLVRLKRNGASGRVAASMW